MPLKQALHPRRASKALFLCLAVLFAPAALAHEAPKGWDYPLSCCSNYDCRPVTNGAISERPEGYVMRNGEVLAYNDKRIRRSPDGDYHWCSHNSGLDAGRTICLFVPPRGF
jgi:hypothetical protein